MKRYLLSIMMLASSATVVASEYASCTDKSNTDICQAYLAGLSHGKASADTTADTMAMVEQDKTFRSRALEHRVGERYRKTVQEEKKPVQSTN